MGLKLFVEAVFGVEQAEVAMYSGGHLRELLRSMEDSNMQLYSLTLRIPCRILEQLSEALLTNLSKVTFVKIKLISPSRPWASPDSKRVLLALAENQFKKLKGVSLEGEGGSLFFIRNAGFAKMVAALPSLRSFRLSGLFHGKALNALEGIPGVNVANRLQDRMIRRSSSHRFEIYGYWKADVCKGTIF